MHANPPPQTARHRVVIVGSGFGGLWAARRLKRADVAVTVVDRTTHHLFQPLLYQVATGILSEGEIAPPMRDILRRQANTRVVLGDVCALDLDARTVTSQILDQVTVTPYDSLIVAAGVRTSYFGHDEYERHAPGLKTIEDALRIRAAIFGAFEMAELEGDPDRRRAWMTFAVVGAGPTGVEMAGQIAELSRRTLTSNFRAIDPGDARIVLIDAVDEVLGQFSGRLPKKAARSLKRLGVELQLSTKVTGVDDTGLDLDGPGPGRLEARTKVWGAGVQASPLGEQIAGQSAAELNRKGQVQVNDDCSVPGRPEVYVVGDLMALDELPGVAEVAMQSGRHAAAEIAARLEPSHEPQPFVYRDLGTLASIGRYSAVGEIGPLRFWGFVGWLAWLVVHLTFLTGFKNRISALAHWTVSFLGRARSERTFAVEQVRDVPDAGRDQSRLPVE